MLDWIVSMVVSLGAWNWFIATLCRASDGDRAPRFFQALKALGADGKMSDLDDGPEQKPLTENIFGLGDIGQRGVRWLRAEQLMMDGVNKAVGQLHQILARSASS